MYIVVVQSDDVSEWMHNTRCSLAAKHFFYKNYCKIGIKMYTIQVQHTGGKKYNKIYDTPARFM